MCLQFGHEGDDVNSMTRRWQFMHTTATMFPVRVYFFASSSGFVELVFSSEVGKDEMLSSRSSFCSFGFVQLLLSVFLFK